MDSYNALLNFWFHFRISGLWFMSARVACLVGLYCEAVSDDIIASPELNVNITQVVKRLNFPLTTYST